MPLSVWRERQKIEVAESDIVSSFKRSLRVANGVMVVKIAPEQLVLARSTLGLREMDSRPESTGSHSLNPPPAIGWPHGRPFYLFIDVV